MSFIKKKKICDKFQANEQNSKLMENLKNANDLLNNFDIKNFTVKKHLLSYFKYR